MVVMTVTVVRQQDEHRTHSVAQQLCRTKTRQIASDTNDARPPKVEQHFMSAQRALCRSCGNKATMSRGNVITYSAAESALKTRIVRGVVNEWICRLHKVC